MHTAQSFIFELLRCLVACSATAPLHVGAVVPTEGSCLQDLLAEVEKLNEDPQAGIWRMALSFGMMVASGFDSKLQTCLLYKPTNGETCKGQIEQAGSHKRGSKRTQKED